jgi:hypothetical protein
VLSVSVAAAPAVAVLVTVAAAFESQKKKWLLMSPTCVWPTLSRRRVNPPVNPNH